MGWSAHYDRHITVETLYRRNRLRAKLHQLPTIKLVRLPLKRGRIQVLKLDHHHLVSPHHNRIEPRLPLKPEPHHRPDPHHPVPNQTLSQVRVHEHNPTRAHERIPNRKRNHSQIALLRLRHHLYLPSCPSWLYLPRTSLHSVLGRSKLYFTRITSG